MLGIPNPQFFRFINFHCYCCGVVEAFIKHSNQNATATFAINYQNIERLMNLHPNGR